jgi:hypothetical protein
MKLHFALKRGALVGAVLGGFLLTCSPAAASSRLRHGKVQTEFGPIEPSRPGPVWQGMPFPYWPAVWNYRTTTDWAIERAPAMPPVVLPQPKHREMLPVPGKTEPTSQRMPERPRQVSPYASPTSR